MATLLFRMLRESCVFSTHSIGEGRQGFNTTFRQSFQVPNFNTGVVSGAEEEILVSDQRSYGVLVPSETRTFTAYILMQVQDIHKTLRNLSVPMHLN